MNFSELYKWLTQLWCWKKCQCHWKCNEQVKLNVFDIMRSLTFITCMVSEKIPILTFLTSPDTWPTKNTTCKLSSLNTHKSKKHNLQFIFLIHLWPWNSQSHQNYNENVAPRKVIIIQSMKDLALTVSEKIATFKFFVFQTRR